MPIGRPSERRAPETVGRIWHERLRDLCLDCLFGISAETIVAGVLHVAPLLGVAFLAGRQ